MSSCPSCNRGHLRETVEYATTCCDVECTTSKPAACPDCGQSHPGVYKKDHYYECSCCGFVEVVQAERALYV